MNTSLPEQKVAGQEAIVAPIANASLTAQGASEALPVPTFAPIVNASIPEQEVAGQEVLAAPTFAPFANVSVPEQEAPIAPEPEYAPAINNTSPEVLPEQWAAVAPAAPAAPSVNETVEVAPVAPIVEAPVTNTTSAAQAPVIESPPYALAPVVEAPATVLAPVVNNTLPEVEPLAPVQEPLPAVTSAQLINNTAPVATVVPAAPQAENSTFVPAAFPDIQANSK